MSDEDRPDLTAVLEHYDVRTKDRMKYMTNCPLHEDRTPSLSVNADKGLWNCHSCGESGDVWSLLMKKEGVGFAEATALAGSLGFGTAGTDRPEEFTGSAYGGRRRKAGDKRKPGSGYVPAWRRSS